MPKAPLKTKTVEIDGEVWQLRQLTLRQLISLDDCSDEDAVIKILTLGCDDISEEHVDDTDPSVLKQLILEIQALNGINVEAEKEKSEPNLTG